MKLIIAVLLCLPAVALDNAVRLYEATGTAQMNRPQLISHQFAQGEFPAGYFPQPYINGVAAPVWQAAVKTTWPDGSVQWALIALRLTLSSDGNAVMDFRKSTNACHLGSAAICADAALTQTQMLNFDTGGGAGSWDGQIEGTLNSITNTANARTMLSSGTWSCWACGPVLTWVIVEDKTTFTHNFGWQYSGGTWGNASSAAYKSLLPAFGLQFWPDPDGGGSITAWPGVEIEGALHHGMATRIQRIPLDSLVMKTGSALSTIYTQTNANMIARRMWHKIGWSGIPPGAVQEDHNLPHLIGTRLLPPYNTSLMAEALDRQAVDLSTYNTRVGSIDPQFCTDANYCANWTKATATAGMRGDIAMAPQWYVCYLYAMSASSGKTVADRLEIWNKLVLGNADASTTVPAHLIESDSGRTAYLGRVVSLAARPTLRTYSSWEIDSNTNAGDRLVYACSSDPCNGAITESNATYSMSWQVNGWGHWLSHMSDYYYVPALLTGRWFYARGEQYLAAYAISTNAGWYRGGSTAISKGMGLFMSNVDWRGVPWALRTLMMGYIVTPDSDADKTYFKSILDNNELMWEGYYRVDGNRASRKPADPTCVGKDVVYGSPNFPSEPWCVGYKWHTYGSATGPTYNITNDNGNPLRFPSFGSQTSPFINAVNVENSFFYYYGSVAFGWLGDVGAIQYNGSNAFRHVAREYGRWATGAMLGVKNVGLFQQYENPYVDTSFGDRRWFATWAGWEAAHGANAPLNAGITAGSMSIVIQSGTHIAYLTQYAKIDDEWIWICSAADNTPSAGKITLTVCANGRGAWGTIAASHDAGAAVYRFWPTQTETGNRRTRATSYAQNHWYSSAPYFQDIWMPGLGSGLKAYERGNGEIQYRHYNPADSDSLQDAFWAFKPRDEIRRLRVEPGIGGFTMRWVAPSGAACKVHAGAAEAESSDDSLDAVSAAASREQRSVVTGLPAGTAYYRITCGTARSGGIVAIQ